MLHCCCPYHIDFVYIEGTDLVMAPSFQEMDHPSGVASVNHAPIHGVLFQWTQSVGIVCPLQLKHWYADTEESYLAHP